MQSSEPCPPPRVMSSESWVSRETSSAQCTRSVLLDEISLRASRSAKDVPAPTAGISPVRAKHHVLVLGLGNPGRMTTASSSAVCWFLQDGTRAVILVLLVVCAKCLIRSWFGRIPMISCYFVAPVSTTSGWPGGSVEERHLTGRSEELA
jgi:hypothetical protein